MTRLAPGLVVLAGAALAACPRPAPAPAPTPPPSIRHAPSGGSTVSDARFPNVHARLRVSQKAPSLTRRDDELEIWLDGSRFHVRDHGGRGPGELLDELAAPRGLGVPARTMEAIMDRNTAARRKPEAPTDLYGDLATGDGWVFESPLPPRPMSAASLLPAATQILGADAADGLTRAGEVTRLGRAATEYRGTVEVTEDGARHQNAVVRVIAAPYVLLDETRSAASAEHFYIRELIALDEGAATDADLTPPAR